MKKKELLNALKKMKKIANGKSTLPILDKVFFNDGKMIVYNLVTCVMYKTDIKEKCLIDCNTLYKIVSNAKGDPDITIKTNNHKISVLINKIEKFHFRSEDIEDYPQLPIFEQDGKWVPSQNDINNFFIATKYVANNELRPSLNCVYVADHIVSSDTHRMVYFKKENKSKPFLVPMEIFSLLDKKVNFYFEHGKLIGGKQAVKAVFSDHEIFVLLDNLKYPAYQSVIPQEYTSRAKLDKEDFIENLCFAKTVANQSSFLGVLSLNSKVLLKSQDIDYDQSFISEIKNSLSEGKIEVGFNIPYMEDLVKNCDETVDLKFKSENSAIVINDNMLLMSMMVSS